MDEPEECPICGCSFFTGICRECEYDKNNNTSLF